MDAFWLGVIIIAVVACFLWYFRQGNRLDKEYNKGIDESLKDELIYEPETGAKITLEQAESGQWLLPGENLKKKNKASLRQGYPENSMPASDLIDYLEDIGLSDTRLTGRQTDLLEKTQMYSKYDVWSYSHSFSFDDGIDFVVITPVEYFYKKGLQQHYSESQLLFWIKIDDYGGHYYFRPKTSTEKVFDIFRGDDDIKMPHLECYTLKKAHSILHVIRLIKHFEDENEVEIEIFGDNLLIKTMKWANIEDYTRIKTITETLT